MGLFSRQVTILEVQQLTLESNIMFPMVVNLLICYMNTHSWSLGPAPESVTDKIYDLSKKLSSYKLLPGKDVDLSKLGSFKYENVLEIEFIDSVKDYVALMKEIFDFQMIKDFLNSRKDFKLLFDGMHGGIYHIFC